MSAPLELAFDLRLTVVVLGLALLACGAFVYWLRRQHGKAVRRAEQRGRESLASALEISGTALLTLTPSGRITVWSRAAERLFGFDRRQAVGADLETFLSVDRKSALTSAKLAQAAAQRQRLDVTCRKRDGRELPVELSVADDPLRSGEFLVLVQDVRDRRQLQQQLSRAQKLESLGQLAAGVAHEINTPAQYVGDNIRFLRDAFSDIQPVICQVERLLVAAEQRPLPLEEEMETLRRCTDAADLGYLQDEIPCAITQSLEGVQRVCDIVRAMKKFSHLNNTAEPTPVNLNEAIASAITVARNEWKYVAEIVTDFDSDLPDVPCLESDFNQMVLNLIVNSAHAIESKFGDGSEGKGQITVRTRRADGWAVIQIADNGCGIPEEIRERVFDPFFTTKGIGKGTGQGLMIAQTVATERHSGSLSFESECGVGTTMTIRLPLEARESAEGVTGYEATHSVC